MSKRVTTQDLNQNISSVSEKLDQLISIMLQEKLEQEPSRPEHIEPESRPNNPEFQVSDKYKDVQAKKMAEYAANKGERFYMFGAVNKSGQHKLRFFSRTNCKKYGNDLKQALAYCDPGKATVWS